MSWFYSYSKTNCNTWGQFKKPSTFLTPSSLGCHLASKAAGSRRVLWNLGASCLCDTFGSSCLSEVEVLPHQKSCNERSHWSHDQVQCREVVTNFCNVGIEPSQKWRSLFLFPARVADNSLCLRGQEQLESADDQLEDQWHTRGRVNALDRRMFQPW